MLLMLVYVQVAYRKFIFPFTGIRGFSRRYRYRNMCRFNSGVSGKLVMANGRLIQICIVLLQTRTIEALQILLESRVR